MPWTDSVFLQAAPRLLISGAVMGLVAVAASRWVARRGPEAPLEVRMCATATIVAATLVATGIALGAVGALRGPAWALAVAAVAALMLLPRRSTGAAAPSPEPWGLPGAPGTTAGAPSLAFAVAVLGILVGRALFGLRNPPSDIDSLHYHLPMLGNWIATSGLGLPLREPPATSECYPGNGQLLQLWAVWSTGRETLVPWPGIASIGVLALALRRLAVDFGARVAVAEAGAVALACAPGVLQLTFGSRIDNMLAAGFAVSLVHALRWRRSGRPFDRDVMLLALGLVAGLKGTAPAHAVLVVALAVAAPGVGARLAALARPSLGLLAAAVCGGFWVIRNTVAAGNPLYPAELRLGPWTLPGELSREFLNGTMQVEMWRQGYAGNLTPANLWDFYGMGGAFAAAGLIAWAATSRASGAARGSTVVGAASAATATASPVPASATTSSASASLTAPAPAPRLLLAWPRLLPGTDAMAAMSPAATAAQMIGLALVCFVLFLISPYSGAFWPAIDGRPPRLAMDNVRYLWPALVATFPVASLGISRLPGAALLMAGLAALSLGLLTRLAGHLVPGVALAAAGLALTGWWSRRRGARAWWAVAAGGLVAALALAAAVAYVDPLRERLNDRFWDERHAGGAGLDAASFHAVRARARGGSIALVGRVDAWWMCYGRDFSGRPTYVPVAIEWRRRPPTFALLRDDRDRADGARWRANLDRAEADAVVIGAVDDSCRTMPREALWCAEDARAFEPLAQTPCASAFARHDREP